MKLFAKLQEDYQQILKQDAGPARRSSKANPSTKSKSRGKIGSKGKSPGKGKSKGKSKSKSLGKAHGKSKGPKASVNSGTVAGKTQKDRKPKSSGMTRKRPLRNLSANPGRPPPPKKAEAKKKGRQNEGWRVQVEPSLRRVVTVAAFPTRPEDDARMTESERVQIQQGIMGPMRPATSSCILGTAI